MGETSQVEILLTVSIIIVCMVCNHFLRKYEVTFLPESVVEVSLGIICALIWAKMPSLPGLNFNYEIFFTVLLPFIIFESGFSVHRQSFFRNAGSILTFAIVGTFISSIAISAILYWLSLLTEGYTFWDALIVGSIMSSTDPVATLSIFNKMNVDTTVKSLIFGESVLNDAVSIILLKTLKTLYADQFKADTFFIGCLRFSINFIGTTLIGLSLSALVSLLLKRTALGRNNRAYEIIFVFLGAYASYFLSEYASLSGIVCIFCYGISTRHYTYHTLSIESQQGLILLFESMKEFCEILVFSLLGLTILQQRQDYAPYIVIITIIATLSSRAFHIYLLSLFLNIKRKRKITGKIQLVLWNAGLRGAVAYGLAVSNLMPDTPKKLEMITTIHACVLITIFFHGMLTLPILRLTKVFRSDTPVDTSHKTRMKIYRYWNVIDKNYITPFISNPREYESPEEEFFIDCNSEDALSMDTQTTAEETSIQLPSNHQPYEQYLAIERRT